MTPPVVAAHHDPGHVLDVTRRFADMDLLGHVNNVRYLDYVTAGREALLRSYGADPAAARVLRHRVGFVAPMVFGRAPAQVRSGVVGLDGTRATLAHRVVSHGHRGDGDETLHLQVETELDLGDAGALGGALDGAAYVEAPAWRDVVATDRPHRHVVTPDVRTRDLGPDGAARDDAVMEFFQEARVRYFMDLHTSGEDWGHVVVAHTDLDLHAPVRPGPGTEVRSWIGHLGGSSFSVRNVLVGADGTLLAATTVVLVCFDASAQQPAQMRPAQRARLEQELV
ncbi:acyl-CoA thioesterase [Nocardioides marmoraquaticus]